MKMGELEAKIKTLENRVRTLEDIDKIIKLQRAYGYYLEHWMAQEIIDLFSDGPGVFLEFSRQGKYLGKEGVKKYFNHVKGESKGPETLHTVMQLSGIVDVEPDGKMAKGRWYGYGELALPQGGGVKQETMSGIYEVEYVKEDGVWKFKTLRWKDLWCYSRKEGFVSPERIAAFNPRLPHIVPDADIPDDLNTDYPSGFIFPFHYKHPVTGKETSEKAWNASLNIENGPLKP